MLSEIKQPDENITYANLWINGNYKKFVENVSKIEESPFVICNKRGESGMYPFDVSAFYPVQDDCVNYWQNNKQSIIKDMDSIAKSASGELFLISAGPLSEVLIHNLWISNPKNRYIDVGSAIDEFVHLSKTRPFMVEGSNYYNHMCKF